MKKILFLILALLTTLNTTAQTKSKKSGNPILSRSEERRVGKECED